MQWMPDLYLTERAMSTQKNILIIDDEESIRNVLHTHLHKEGYNVISSRGGASVFDDLKNNAFDIVISDIKMPDVDGFKVLEFVKTHYDTVPVVMLTGLSEVGVAVEVMKRGAFDYAVKPVQKKDLLVIIKKALEHRDLLERNKALERENREYQLSLEKKVQERTRDLDSKTAEVKKAYSILKSMNLQFVNVLAETIEAKDRHTRGHCNRMRFLCVELGRLAGLSEKDIEFLEYASILHDLGKISVSDFILNKNGPLDKDELDRIKEHPEIGEKILQGIPMMDTVAKIIGAHHENFDGTGYPKGLKGPDIPLPARIIAVADIFDAMTSDRPYRKGLPLNVVLDEMNRVSGTQLDPAMAGLFIGHRLYRFNGVYAEGRAVER